MMMLLQSVCMLIVTLQIVYGGQNGTNNTVVCADVNGTGNIVFINLSLQDCVNGKVVSKQIQPVDPVPIIDNQRPVEYKLTTQRITTQKPKSKEPRPTSPHHGNGYQGCGYERYHPDFQTCCKETSYKYTIHQNMAEQEHVCCGQDAFKRSNVPCRHSARNDRFYTRQRIGRKKTKRLAKLSIRYEYAFDVQVTAIGDRGYLVNIQQITGVALNNTRQKRVNMNLPTDKYSPKGPKLQKRSYLVLAKTDLIHYLLLDFILSPDDKVFFVCRGNRRRMDRLIKKLKAECKRNPDYRKARRRFKKNKKIY